MSKAVLEEQQWFYLIHSWQDKGVHTFPKVIRPKMNVIAWLEFKLAFYDCGGQRFNYYNSSTPPNFGCSSVSVSVCLCLIQNDYMK